MRIPALSESPLRGNLMSMAKRGTKPRREARPEDVDVGQIEEMLRLTPTQRLRKTWRYGRLVLEMQHAAGLRAPAS
jgi:hypothetical protein